MKIIKSIKLSKDKENYEVFNITVDEGKVINDIELDKFLKYIDGYIDKTTNNIINKYKISRSDKEDIKQEIYIKLLSLLPKIDVNKNFKGYISRSITNHMKNIVQSTRKKDRLGMMALYDSEIINDMDIAVEDDINILDMLIYKEEEGNKGDKR